MNNKKTIEEILNERAKIKLSKCFPLIYMSYPADSYSMDFIKASLYIIYNCQYIEGHWGYFGSDEVEIDESPEPKLYIIKPDNNSNLERVYTTNDKEFLEKSLQIFDSGLKDIYKDRLEGKKDFPDDYFLNRNGFINEMKYLLQNNFLKEYYHKSCEGIKVKNDTIT